MTASILQWVRTIVIYLILVSAVMHVLPDNQYKKYVQLFVGLLLILIVVGPVGEAFSGGHLVETLYQKAVQWQEDQERDRVLEQIDETGRKTLLDSYERAVEERLAEQVKNEGYQEEQIQAKLTEDGIDSITLALRPLARTDREAKKQEEKRLGELLAEIYGISPEKINIKIR